jgi:hypothetical protein
MTIDAKSPAVRHLALAMLFLPLSLFSCSVPYTKTEARVEDVSAAGTVRTNKGTFICGNCLPMIRSQQYYIFYLKDNKIRKMEKSKTH